MTKVEKALLWIAYSIVLLFKYLWRLIVAERKKMPYKKRSKPMKGSLTPAKRKDKMKGSMKDNASVKDVVGKKRPVKHKRMKNFSRQVDPNKKKK